jgi:hypothetical protein
MYSPVNVTGPDQRRKQLMAKLGQQAQGNMASQQGVAASVGTGLKAAMHAMPRAQSTQSTNILPSVLARLGILGNPKADEVSQGFGAPIDSPHGTPLLSSGSGTPIPTAGASPQLPAAPQHFTAAEGSAMTGPAIGQPGGPAYGSSIDSGIPGAPPLVFNAPSDPSVANDDGFNMQYGGGGAIPLGGGHFFDPVSGQVVYNPAAASGGAAGVVFGNPNARMV